MTPDEYCRQRTAASGSSFYYSFRFLPAAQRRAIHALYAFCREVDDVVDECSDAGVARTTLEWWRDELSRVYDGTPQHPVGQALAPVVVDYGLAREHFEELLDGMAMDIGPVRYATLRELGLYCYRAAGVVGILAAQLFGARSHHTLKYAVELGHALQLVNIIRDVREDAARDRIYLPQALLARHGVAEADLLALRQPDGLAAALAELAGVARDHYRKALAWLPLEERRDQRSGLMMAAIYFTLLDEVEADGFQVMRHRIHLGTLRKLWIAGRVAFGPA